MLLILVLQKLTEGRKGLGAFGTVVREVWYIVRWLPTSIRQLRLVGKVGCHATLLDSIVVDLLACVVLSFAPPTKSTFHVLDSIGSRLEAYISTDRTCHIASTMHLHVHVQLILITKVTATFVAFEGRVVSLDAVTAARTSITFHPLIATEARAACPISTIRTITAHMYTLTMPLALRIAFVVDRESSCEKTYLTPIPVERNLAGNDLFSRSFPVVWFECCIYLAV